MEGMQELISLSDEAFGRTRNRLADLTDPEYFWEPVAGCWSVRLGHDDVAAVDWELHPKASPFTTIAWRLWHLVGCYGADRNEQLLLGTDDGQGDVRCAPRATADAAVIALDEANHWWHGVLSQLSEDDLSAPLGPRAGPYADSSKAAYVLHQLDEMIHHGAELGVLRDLYAARSPQPCEPKTAAGLVM
jgi:hypothetical protein